MDIVIKMSLVKTLIVLLMSVWLFSSANVFADELLIGTATADITPSLPVALAGQPLSHPRAHQPLVDGGARGDGADPWLAGGGDAEE